MAVAVKKPWFKFYPQDWRGDAKLRSCSIGARGLWAEMLCIMHEAVPYGYLLLGSVPVSNRQLASLAGISQKEALAFLAELGSAGVFSRDEKGVILSRRMVRDHERAQKGRDDANKRWGNGDDDGKPIGTPNGAQHGTPITPEARSQIDDAGDASVRAPLVTREAQTLADELLVIAGHRIEFVPPGWCGAAMRVQAWLAKYPPEIIRIAVKAAAARKRGGPANSVQFFENAVAEEFARQSAPLPNIEIRPAETLTVTTHAKPKSAIIQAADDLCRRIASFDGPTRGADELRSDAGENPPRLLSHG
jgi:hypothetical protein